MARICFIVILISVVICAHERLEEAKSEFTMGNYYKVIQLLENNIPNDSLYYDYWYMLGICYQKMYNYDKANKALYTAYEFNKFDIKLNMALGRNYNLCGAPGYSLLFFKQVYEIDSSYTSALIELADAYYQTRNYEDAIEVYNKLVASDSSNSYFLKELGRCYYKLNKTDIAITCLQKSFEINSRDAGVALLLGGLLVNLQQYEKALKIIYEGLENNGHKDQLLKLCAETLFKMKRYSSAAIQFEAIINDGDSTSLYYRKLGFCFYLTENNDESGTTESDTTKYLSAITAFKNAIRKDSTDALSHIYLGICFKERGEIDDAIRFLERGISLTFPEYLVDAYSQLASGYELKGKYPEAIQTYKKAQEYKPDRRTIIFQIASLYDKFYKDKNIPLLYYQKYLRDTKEQDPMLIEYARSRIGQLREQIHFGY